MTKRTVHEQLARELLAELKKEGPRDEERALTEALLRDAVRERATDVHFEPRHDNGGVIRFRIDGDLLDAAVLPKVIVEHLKNQIKVFGTLHARDAVGAITGMRKWNADNYELSTLLSAIVAQRLVRRLCPDCRRQETPDREQRPWFKMIGFDAPEYLY